MVKSVVGEETRLQIAEERLFQSTQLAQVGLLVGKLSPGLDRGFVYDLLPTPPTDDGRPPCLIPVPAGGSGRDDKRKGAKGGGGRSQAEAADPLIVDVDWVAEHARQVGRLLPGGMHVVGIYVWVSESSFKASTLVLWHTAKEVARAAPIHSSDTQERLLVNASYSPRRWTCRRCMLAATNASASMSPCDFKWGKLLGSLQVFRCIYKFEQRLPIAGEAESETLKDALREAISRQSRQLKDCSRALIDGKLVNEDLPCTSAGTHEVELLLPFMNEVASKEADVAGLLVFSGVISASAYLAPREAASEAISELKGDIINSLHSRLDIVCEEAGLADASVDRGIETEEGVPSGCIDCHDIFTTLKLGGSLSFPRRVLIPWLGSVFVGDYLQPSEAVEVLGSHCREMMSMESPIDCQSLVQAEKEANSPTIKSFRDAALGSSASPAEVSGSRDASQKLGTTGGLKASGSTYLIAAVVLLIAILMGWIVTRTLVR